MAEQNPFTWCHFQPDIIVLCVRWYLRYSLSHDLEEIMRERGWHVDHTTTYRWVEHSAPELEKRCRSHLKATADSWNVDETYVNVKKQWVSLSRAVDSQGKTLDFMLSSTRDAEAAKRFCVKTLAAAPTQEPRVITGDTNASSPKAFVQLKAA